MNLSPDGNGQGVFEISVAVGREPSGKIVLSRTGGLAPIRYAGAKKPGCLGQPGSVRQRSMTANLDVKLPPATACKGHETDQAQS